MSVTREDFMRYRATKYQKEQQSRASGLQLVEQAAVEADKLTGDLKWDYFTSLLQAHCDKAKAQADQLMVLLCDSDTVNAEALLSMKMNYRQLRERQAVLEQVIALPRQIIDVGEQAKLELAEIGGAEE